MAFTYDRRTIDAAGAFLVGELERLDKTLHLPLVSVTWGRDMDLRSDVTIADETSSFTNTSFANAGSPGGNGKNWVGQNSTEITGIDVDISKTPSPMLLWAMEAAWTVVELAAAEQVGRPIDTQKYDGLKLKHNMDIDEQVYIGDVPTGATGLVNNPDIPVENVTTDWATATPVQILDDINGIVQSTWERSAYAVCPSHLLLPPAKFAALTRPVTEAGSKSLLQYIKDECLSNSINGRPLEINPLKWLTGRGTAGTGRMVAYTKNEMYVRFPLVPLQRTPLEARGLRQITTYYGRLGRVEFVYPETVGYADGM